MSLQEKFLSYINEQNLITKNAPLILAVSGGLDSMVLLNLLLKTGFSFSVAHCNFNLRAAESDTDAAFVAATATENNLPFFIKSFNTKTYAAENKVSTQVAARELRYQWFNNLLEELKLKTGQPAFCLTAHHANDDIETMMMNFFKGTGMAGLKGMLPMQKQIIRPLLFAERKVLELYAAENKIKFREDSSNAENKYTRNYFRNELIPSLETVYPQVLDNLKNNVSRFKAANEIYEEAIEKKLKKLMVIKNADVEIAIPTLDKIIGKNALLYELAKKFNFTASQVASLQNLLGAETGKYISSATHRILKNRKWLIISPLKEEIQNIYIIKEAENLLHFGDAELFIKKEQAPIIIDANPLTAQLCLKQVKFPLLLRKRKVGDYFYPLGMKKKKKISKYLSDKKLSVLEKEAIWVLESDKKIVWVVGYAIDERFKISPTSTDILTLVLKPVAR